MSDKYEAFWNEPGPDGCKTLRDWVRLATTELLAEGEGFSAKRPLGDSGWEWAFEEATAKHKVKVIDHAVNWLFRTAPAKPKE